MLNAEDLSKSFDGDTAVEEVSVELEEGEVVGLLGPNGAGKTTTMKMLSGLMQPDSGRVISDNSLREDVAVVFQETEYGSKLKVKEFLDMMAVLNERRVPVRKVINDTRLNRDKDVYVKDMSGGTKKKLNIASGLLKDPKYLLLDEPTAGLDPNAKKVVRNTIKRISEEKGVLISTHIMEEAEKICDRVIIIDEGEEVVSGTVEGLIENVEAEYLLEAEGEVPEAFKPEAVVSNGFFELKTDRPHEILKELVDKELIDEIRKISIKRPGLEDVFFEYAGRRYNEEDP